ncbi:hypothetical protein GCM10010492_60350 [Saccharothrix mutabilis subsp. mutabilis]|uniref:Peptidoglycan binding-like domain-containing protein n=1 Tax=Saccharothrix mutabilis subsp. mutabilis TaxID=66855 RepID=A0ABN0UIM2_9PSEU
MKSLIGRLALTLATAATALTLGATGSASASAEDVSAAALPTCTHKWDYQPATANRSKRCVLGQGNYGNAVLALQQSLKYCYGKNIAVDKDFGPATRTALIQVQRAVGADPDGVYGPETNRKMKWLAATGCRHNPSGD